MNARRVDFNAPFELRDKDGDTSFLIAVLTGNFTIARELVNDFQCDPKSGNSSDTNAAHCLARELKKHEDLSFLDFLATSGTDLESRDQAGHSALHFAAIRNNSMYPRMLLKKAPHLARLLDNRGELLTFLTAGNGSVDVVELLLMHDDLLRDVQTSASVTPLGISASKGHIECMKLLFSLTNVKAPGYFGRTPLVEASCGGQVAAVKLLLQNGAQIDTKSDEGLTSLSVAIAMDNSEVYNFLLNNNPNPKILDNNGVSTLSHAVQIGDKDLVQRLLDMGCESLILHPTNNGWTPYSIAVSKGHTTIVDIFLAHGYDGTYFLDIDGDSSMQASVTGGLAMYSKFRALHPDSLFNINYKGLDLLSYAARRDKILIIFDLVSLDMNVNGLGAGLGTPFHWAAGAVCFETVNTLLELGADPNAVSTLPWGETPLYAARRFPRITTRLLEAGANANAINSLHCTPLQVDNAHIQTIFKISTRSGRFPIEQKHETRV